MIGNRIIYTELCCGQWPSVQTKILLEDLGDDDIALRKEPITSAMSSPARSSSSSRYRDVNRKGVSKIKKPTAIKILVEF